MGETLIFATYFLVVRFGLTAAHCFSQRTDHQIFNEVMAYVGLKYGCRPDNNFTATEYLDRRKLQDVHLHPNYEPKPVKDVGKETRFQGHRKDFGLKMNI